jgi:hypothetical protein
MAVAALVVAALSTTTVWMCEPACLAGSMEALWKGIESAALSEQPDPMVIVETEAPVFCSSTRSRASRQSGRCGTRPEAVWRTHRRSVVGHDEELAVGRGVELDRSVAARREVRDRPRQCARGCSGIAEDTARRSRLHGEEAFRVWAQLHPRWHTRGRRVQQLALDQGDDLLAERCRRRVARAGYVASAGANVNLSAASGDAGDETECAEHMKY